MRPYNGKEMADLRARSQIKQELDLPKLAADHPYKTLVDSLSTAMINSLSLESLNHRFEEKLNYFKEAIPTFRAALDLLTELKIKLKPDCEVSLINSILVSPSPLKSYVEAISTFKKTIELKWTYHPALESILVYRQQLIEYLKLELSGSIDQSLIEKLQELNVLSQRITTLSNELRPDLGTIVNCSPDLNLANLAKAIDDLEKDNWLFQASLGSAQVNVKSKLEERLKYSPPNARPNSCLEKIAADRQQLLTEIASRDLATLSLTELNIIILQLNELAEFDHKLSLLISEGLYTPMPTLYPSLSTEFLTEWETLNRKLVKQWQDFEASLDATKHFMAHTFIESKTPMPFNISEIIDAWSGAIEKIASEFEIQSEDIQSLTKKISQLAILNEQLILCIYYTTKFELSSEETTVLKDKCQIILEEYLKLKSGAPIIPMPETNNLDAYIQARSDYLNNNSSAQQHSIARTRLYKLLTENTLDSCGPPSLASNPVCLFGSSHANNGAPNLSEATTMSASQSQQYTAVVWI